ncbi:hypothetical protein Micbo1qcDRAFT_236972 [Microdochium bolleyi]|uniref:Uncharacterized protein n=1 Tax=Microdochium bolleyi TaxID=196109 RepID=A0A136IMR2_9PEZI|nr:hypothetical protein Micbo1qcDRAFT_236972 [Microdochium bolleyi]
MPADTDTTFQPLSSRGDYESDSRQDQTFSFMQLPIEIRLQIYRLVHRTQPTLELAQTMSWYPMPPAKPYITRELRVRQTEYGVGLGRYPDKSSYSPVASDGVMGTSPTSTHETDSTDISSPTSSTFSEANRDDAAPSSHSDRCDLEDLLPSANCPSLLNHPEKQVTIHCNQRRGRPPARLLPSNRPSAKLPTALLLTSRAVYAECRTLPFEENEFACLTWFSSGLLSATMLAGRLDSWQNTAVRWARVELLSKELEAVYLSPGQRHQQRPSSSAAFGPTSHAYVTDWSRLCVCWADGLRGLRLKVMAAQRVWFGAAWDTATGFGDAGETWHPQQQQPSTLLHGTSSSSGHDGGHIDEACKLTTPHGIIGVLDKHGNPTPWITQGLALLKGLRQLEVELCSTMPVVTASAADAGIPAGEQENDDNDDGAGLEQKRLTLRWCAELEDVLNREKAPGENRIRVVSVIRENGP